MLGMSLGVFELTPEQADAELAVRLARKQARARQLDAAVVRIAHSRGAIELALGEALARLFDSDGLLKLGYARRVDYARERLGIPPRTMYGWVRLARAVEGRPLLRQAVLDGSVTPHKALAVAPLLVAAMGGDADEAHWVAVAARLPLKELAALVQYLIQRFVSPLREHLDSDSRPPAHRCLHSGRRFSTNACSPSSASSVSMSSSM